MYANIKETFLNKQQPNIAQSLAKSGIGNNIVQQAQQTTSPWANLIANALNSGLGVYDVLKTNKQNKIADEQANEYSNKIADALKNKNYDEATVLSAGIGDYENALQYANIGQNLLKRQEDNQFRDKQFGLNEQQFLEQQNQNRFSNDYNNRKLQLEYDKLNMIQTPQTQSLTQDDFNNTLERAIKLSNSAEGMGGLFGAIGTLGAKTFNTDDNKAFKELKSVVQTQMLPQMKSIFGANPTEGERKAMEELSGIEQSMDSETRNKIIMNAFNMIAQKQGLKPYNSNNNDPLGLRDEY